MRAFFISGTDTDCGKTHVTAQLAAQYLREGKKVATQKFIQTGCEGISEDIIAHRSAMNIELLPEDLSGESCPYVFKFPASPHLAASLEGVQIDAKKITAASEVLLKKYEILLIEGAGGLMVPISQNYLTIDYIAERDLPLIFVVPSKLGSINHALLSVEACLLRGVKLAKIAFNDFPQVDKILADETFAFVKTYAQERFPKCEFLYF